ncbi:MAG TPA: DNA polymerase I [Thermoanaerobaculia bacterium]|nr:DNA polymerase I [Thermoanaerobaculia bacterium]
MAERLLLIDSNSLIYRGYFAIPPLTTTKGELSNATFGFASILLKAFELVRPEHAAACFDLPGKTFRHERDATYKATRKPMPDDLRPQFERCKEFLGAMGIPIYALPGFEADDVIGALSRQAEAAGLETMILSGDLDPLQLVNPLVKLMTTRQGFQNTVVYDEAAIFERYGLRPDQMIDYKALKGDTTDNIAGVPGIGEKTASKLIAEHKTLEGVYEDLALLPDRQRKALEEHREQVFRSREQARIVTELPVTLETERTRFGPYDRSKVLDLFQELEFRSLAPRLPPADGNLASPAPSVAAPVARSGQLSLGLEPAPSVEPPVATKILTPEAVDEAVAALEAAAPVAVYADAEPGRHPKLVGLGLATNESCWYLPVEGPIPARIAELLQSEVAFVAHDAKTVRRALRRAGSDLGGVQMDTMLASYLSNASRRQHLLDDLAQERLQLGVPALPAPDRKDPNRVATQSERAARAGAAATATLRLATLFTADLERLSLTKLFEEIELPLVSVLVEMEEAGIAVDVPYLAKLATEFAGEVARIEREAHASVGHEFGITSPKQLESLLFTELKLQRGRRNKTGYSTDAAVLEELRGAHPVVDKILEHREVEKLRTTYAEGLAPLVDPATGRIHTTFEQAVASTGRLSSRAPNLQNIPIRTPLGRRIRRAFVAGGADRVLVAADYSQIELRILAHVSQDPALLDAFLEGADVHRRTAAAGFRVPESEVTRQQRDVAKMLNFGIIYGMSDFGLAWRMQMPREEAAVFIEEYFKKYGQVRRYIIETKAMCTEQGYVETLLGRRRYIPDMTSSNRAVRGAAERMAINMPIQGTAADIMKIGMNRVRDRLRSAGLDALLVLQVHDELVLEVAREDVDRLAGLVCDEMIGAYALDVPLMVDVRTGTNWDEMTPLPARTPARA